MIDLAKKQKVFLMEGMWSRFFPVVHKVDELIRQGVIGDIQYVTADFGFSAPLHLDGRLYNTALGGGAQLDVGIYPLFLVLWLLGKPSKISASSKLASTGADLTTGAELTFESGAMAQILSSIVADSPKEAIIAGTKGRLHIHPPWYKSESVTLRLNSGESTTFPFPHSGNGFEFQIQEVVRCLSQGQKQCELMSHDFSLLLAEVSDEIRRQGGIHYMADNKS
jgi:predicted dehydrogenase